MTVIGYIRVSTDEQDVDKQRYRLLAYAQKQQLPIREFISVEVSSRKNTKERRIDELLEKLADSHTLIVTELSRQGRSTSEVIVLVNELVQRPIRVIVTKQNLDLRQNNDVTAKVMITLFSLFAELERDLISLRTREVLAAKNAQDVFWGKPKGTVQESILHSRRGPGGEYRWILNENMVSR
jgi:DNA invertase Pin-like site-specific DNA recombinase